MEKLGTLKDFSAMFVRTGDYDLYLSEYHYGGIAIQAVDPVTSETAFTASVFMEGYVPSGPDKFWVKGWSENEGIVEELVGHGVIELTGRTAQAGYATAQEATLMDSEDWYKG